MKRSDFPGIQQAADEASDKSQKYYVSLLRLNLLVGIIAALMTIFNFEQPQPKRYVYEISLVLLIVNLALTGVIKYFKYEELWYQARALAESLKTLTWRYSTCSENFESTVPEHDVQKFFSESLHAIQNKFPKLITFMDNTLLSGSVITPGMTNMRKLPWPERLQLYKQFRIGDQITWYSTKAVYNKRKKVKWLWIVITAQALAVVSCTSLIFFPSSSWNLVGLFTTVGASAIAWLELKQYQSLIQAYTVAAMELTLINSLTNTLSTEVEFSKYVLDSENAISREHTMWLAQKRK